YLGHLPAAGDVVIFDRSWYNRAGVERVMGFCSGEQVDKFLTGVPGFERVMVDSGIILIKYWLEVSADEQTRRLQDRINDGRKLWKLSPMDLKSYSRWDEYTQARDEMFQASDTAWAPWFMANSNDKRRARLNIISHLLSRIPYKDITRDQHVKLPKRGKIGKYKAVAYPFKFVEERF
ncbi:polyphosphate kinase 2, partial [Pseudomonas qingdaonensis]|uniref:polyphosphate kinase 2 n=1 Tax=Pseudomonas qingdaonensis TaxID=2056231 RepID=UPI003516FB65